eukprot:779302-Rhodomonas_salina.1
MLDTLSSPDRLFCQQAAATQEADSPDHGVQGQVGYVVLVCACHVMCGANTPLKSFQNQSCVNFGFLKSGCTYISQVEVDGAIFANQVVIENTDPDRADIAVNRRDDGGSKVWEIVVSGKSAGKFAGELSDLPTRALSDARS